MKSLSSIIIACLVVVLHTAFSPAPCQAGDDPFPTFSCIEANVAFWKKVYSEYPSTQGLIHDSENLAIVYEVVTLPTNGSSEGLVNSRKEYYQAILARLAGGAGANTPEEKRVAGLFGARTDPAALRAAIDTIRFQRCLSDRFRAGIVRSGRYLVQIKEIMTSYGLPTDLAYLPHVESSFDYQAYSKAGAAGIWQLIPATGRRFLTVNDTVDERRDPIRATHAAAQFLRGNYRKLRSWPLALTAYNHGLTSMLRAKNALGCYETIYHRYDDSRFGFASKNFYAEFLAARDIARNYQRYFPGTKLDSPISTREATVKKATGIKVLAGQFKVPSAVLAELNPALSDAVVKGKRHVPKDYRLHLPRNSHASSSKLATKSPKKSRPERKSAQVHRVKRGETLNKIADRYGVSTRELIAHNQLSNAELLSVGQSLKIPTRPSKRNAM